MGQFDSWTVAEALRVERKIEALHAILGGSVDVESFTILGDDWDIEERSRSALEYWGLLNVKLDQKMSSLSGERKRRFSGRDSSAFTGGNFVGRTDESFG